MLCWGELTSGSGQNPCSQSEEILKGERVQHVCSREGVTVFVLENGKVYTRVRGWKRKSKPGQFTHFKEQKIDIAESGISHILFLSKTGIVFQSEVKSKETAAKVKEFSMMKPQVLKSLSDTHIIQVACGNNHSLTLSKNGQLFAWGQNTYGQLGHGTKDVSQHSPQSVISLTGMPVAQIAAGGEHSFALSLSGTVFGWGRNNHGQLGLKDTEDRLEPNHVTLLKGKRTIYIACGEEHTAVLTKGVSGYEEEAGKGSWISHDCTESWNWLNEQYRWTCLHLWSWSYGQLGHNSTKDEIKPHLVGYLFGSKVSQIACGSYHTLVFVPSCGKIYSFGRGEEGQLGNKETRDQLVPLSINITDIFAYNGYEDGHGAKLAVKRIFAGGHQSFAECCDEMDLLPCVNQSFNTLRRIVTVDQLLEQELDKNTRKGIVRAFSSSQTLCGSFLDVNKDGHFKTNGETSGLNLSAAYLGFVMLAKNSSVLQQVKTAVQHHLIPSLPRSPTCVETLRVYIIIPELIAVLGESRDSATLLESLSRSILSLEDSYFKILERWWCKMPYYFFLRLVRMYQKESHRLLQLTMTGASQCNPQLHNSLKILQTLYQVNFCRHHTIQERNFCIPVMKVIKDSLTAFAAQCFPKAPRAVMDPFVNNAMRGCYMPFEPEYEQFKQYLSVLCKIKEELIPFRCIFDMETKLKLWKMESQMLQKQTFISEPILSLEVSRDAVLRDVLDNLRSQGTGDQYVAFQVEFTGEDSFGYGVTQEFFTLLGRELHSNGQIFQQHEESGLLWFPSREPEMDDAFYLLGILCRFVVSNGFICNFHFPLALYKKLLHVPPTLDDLKELSPTEGKSLQDVLDYEYDDIEETFYLDFTIPVETADGMTVRKELIPNGNNTPVQKHNRKQFVDAYVDYRLNTTVEQEFEAFSRGFRSRYSLPVVDIFLPEELRDVIQGNTKYEWELLEQNAIYDGYARTDAIVRNFWEVFENLSEDMKKQFLAFLTGSDRIPVGGIGNLRIQIINNRSEEPDSTYPCAYTCTRTLDLPNYSSIEILREKLLHAMKFGEEFTIIWD